MLKVFYQYYAPKGAFKEDISLKMLFLNVPLGQNVGRKKRQKQKSPVKGLILLQIEKQN